MTTPEAELAVPPPIFRVNTRASSASDNVTFVGEVAGYATGTVPARLSGVAGGVPMSGPAAFRIPRALEGRAPLTVLLPYNRAQLQSLRSDIKAIRSLPPNFDGEDSEAYDDATINGALATLASIVFSYVITYGRDLPVPEVEAGSSGSVDLHWRFARYELVLRSFKGRQGELEMYGTNHAGDAIHKTGPRDVVAASAMDWLHHRWRSRH